MKSRFFSLIVVIVCGLVFGACGMNSAPSSNSNTTYTTNTSDRKITYTASFTIVCKDFDATLNLIENGLAEDEWFDIMNYEQNSAYFKARIRSARLDEYLNDISNSVGRDNINNLNRTATDISLSYFDTQGQIDALQTERTRLLEIMSSSGTTIGDLIQINSRLSAIDLELQKLSGELYNFDSLIEYSVVEIWIEKESYGWIIALSVLGVGILISIILIVYYHKRKKKVTKTFQNNTMPPPAPYFGY